jgi:hypothetical protein
MTNNALRFCLLSLAICLTSVSTAAAENVDVRYHGPVSLDTFDCPTLRPSSFVNRICYDEEREYLIVQLDGAYYHYCGVDAGTVEAWLNAPSLGRFYNAEMRGGPFDCRVVGIPD